jgi:hypothetical protein
MNYRFVETGGERGSAESRLSSTWSRTSAAPERRRNGTGEPSRAPDASLRRRQHAPGQRRLNCVVDVDFAPLTDRDVHEEAGASGHALRHPDRQAIDTADAGGTVENRHFTSHAFERTDRIEVRHPRELCEIDPSGDVAGQDVALRSGPADLDLPDAQDRSTHTVLTSV